MTFTSGKSGNPNGRPRGIIDKRSELRALLEPHAEDIVLKLIERAKIGDPAAMRLCIERLLPRVKPDSGINFELPEGKLDTADNMLQITDGITRAVASGQMTIEEAEKFIIFLRAQCRQIEEAERKKRTEQWQKDKS